MRPGRSQWPKRRWACNPATVLSSWWLPEGAEADARFLSDVRNLIRVHLGGGGHLWDIRRSAAALPGAALLKLIVASTILAAIIYGSTIVLYLVVRNKLDRKQGAFNLGRFEMPVAISALVWVACALFVLTVARDALIPDLIVVGLVVAVGLFLLSLLMFHREALDTETLS